MTTTEAAAVLHVPRLKVYRWVVAGLLPAAQTVNGYDIRMTPEGLIALVATFQKPKRGRPAVPKGTAKRGYKLK